MNTHEPVKLPLLTYAQGANRLQVCLNTFRGIVEKGELVRVKVGLRGVRVTTESLDAYIARQMSKK